ncbi:MAG: response regulator, partial [Ekhidna sp.]|nr:response regulator [Ekhidna sp.]
MEEIGNVRILVVDDEYSNVETVLEIIDENIAEVFYAPNGLIAIKLALEERPDLILMDWEMPEMDGIEATKRLKTDDQVSDIPVIISTGKNTTDENLQEAFNAGAVDFIRKPFSTLEFTSRIQSTLRLKRQNDTI